MQVDTHLIKTYEGLIKEHKDIAERYQLALNDLLNRFQPVKEDKAIASTQNKLNLNGFKAVLSKSPSFNTNMVDLLKKEKEPMTATIARTLYNEKYKTSYDKGSFSPKLSFATKKHIKKYTINENPLETRNYYGLPEWFEGEDLKSEYIEKIKADRLGSQLM